MADTPRLRWRTTGGPWYPDMLSTLEFGGRNARIRFNRTAPDAAEPLHMQLAWETELS